MAHIKGFFKKITGDTASYDALAKQPIADAEVKLNLFKEVTSNSISALENYHKYMTKTVDLQLADKFNECKELFKKYESKGELLNPNISHVLGIVFGKLNELQLGLHSEIMELTQNIDASIIRPLMEYQKEISVVKENRKDLKDAYDRIDQCRQSLDKAKRDLENAQRTSTQPSRLMIGASDTNKKMQDIYRMEEKVQRIEKELDDANSTANEKYDKYTEGLFKRVAEECDLTNYYLEYLKIQRRYHKQALKRLDQLIPGVKESLANYNKKPVFGCSLNEYVNNTNSNNNSSQYVSPVIRKLIEGMCKQNVFNEEGIFRIAGSRIKMNCLLYAINAGYLEYLDLNNDFDVHCLAGVLKQYIRELPDSILCNELYDDWIIAINTQMPKKLDTFMSVLEKLPRANYENLKYLIKFLSKIVENSEKTKMTTTNMGICFGVSLLSSNKSLSTSSSVNNLTQSMSQMNHDSNSKSIDMATATNVFDFLLTNHVDLFPGDINFYIGYSSLSSKQSFYQSNSKATNLQSGESGFSSSARAANNNLNISSNSTNEPIANSNQNRYSVMLNESFNSLNETSQNSPFSNKPNNNVNNTSFTNSNANNPSPLNSSSNTNIVNINRHIKNNSVDIKFSEQTNEINNSSISNKIFPSLISQINSNSTISLDSGSSSPKLKGKKQAPAPPKLNNTALNETSVTSPITTVNEETINEQSPNLNSKILNNNSDTSFSSTNSNSSNSLISKISNQNNNSNNIRPSNESLSSLPSRSSSFRTHEISNSINSSVPSLNPILEKPTQPPPQVPIRTHTHSLANTQAPPPIGFNVIGLSSSPNNSFNQNDSPPPFPVVQNNSKNSNQTQTQFHSSESSTSSTSSLSQENLISPNNTLSKPPKPAIPRRPGNGILAHLNKFERKLEEDHVDEPLDESNEPVPKSPSEITSL